MSDDEKNSKGPTSGGMQALPLPSARSAQQLMRLNLELTALTSRRARALLEASRRYAGCRTIEDVIAANTAFAAAFWQDQMAAQQRMFAALIGLPASPPPMPEPAAATVAAAAEAASQPLPAYPDPQVLAAVKPTNGHASEAVSTAEPGTVSKKRLRKALHSAAKSPVELERLAAAAKPAKGRKSPQT